MWPRMVYKAVVAANTTITPILLSRAATAVGRLVALAQRQRMGPQAVLVGAAQGPGRLCPDLRWVVCRASAAALAERFQLALTFAWAAQAASAVVAAVAGRPAAVAAWERAARFLTITAQS